MPLRSDDGAHPDDGLLTRRADRADRRAALRHEASLLQMARHPGVTELIRITDEDGTTVLTTRSGSDHTLVEWDGTEDGSVDTAVIAGVLAALATTVADLHGLGVVHGRIEPQRVAISATGQPVLTGFESAGPIGSISLPADAPLPPFCDPAAGPGRPLRPAVDVFGLGALMEHLLERCPASGSDPHRGARRKLRRLARGATDEAPDCRPTAAELAAAILRAAPAAHLPGDRASSLPPPPDTVRLRLDRPRANLGPPSTGRGVRSAAVAAAVVVVLMGALLALGRNRPAATSATAAASKPVAAAPISIVAMPTTAPPTTGPPASQVRARSTSTTVALAASPPAPPSVDESTFVVFQGVRYRIDGGQRRHAVGDWDCDGRATLATLDPSTGALTFFETWPRAGSTRARPSDHVPGALDLRADRVGGCHQLAIVHAEGVDTYEEEGDSS